MERIILFSGLLILLFYPTFSQQSTMPKIRQWSYSNQVDTSLLNLFSVMQIDSLLSATNPEHIYQLPGIYESRKRNIIDDNMPCIKPKGNYPSLLIVPDTTIRYTLLIRKH